MPKATIIGKKTFDNVTEGMGVNVLEAAQTRIDHILDTYDTVAVAFSGGKDSLVTLHLLAQAIRRKSGDFKPIKVHVVFRDEELIPQHVIDFVDGYRQLPWIEMLWFCVPLKSSKFILGRTYDYIQWDPSRDHIRPKPLWSINETEPVYDQYSMDSKVAEYYKGKICVLTGIRAQESLMRYRAIINKIGNTETCATQCKRLDLGRPIYDWKEDDIFKYLHDNHIAYAEIYDRQSAAGQNLRVSTPLHSESAKRMDTWREIDPEFYDAVIKLFPEVAVQGKYYKDVDMDAGIEQPKDLKELWAWIHRRFSGEQLKMAIKRHSEVTSFWKNPNVRDKYPMEYVFKLFKSGTIKRVFLPRSK